MTNFGYLNRSYSEPIDFKTATKYQLQADDGIPVKPGQKLPNGAILLREDVVRVFEHRRDSLVLCVAFGYQPFASWVRTILSDVPERNDDGSHNSWYNVKDFCETGSYHYELADAIKAYEERLKALQIRLG